jgi:hypothetical protein
MTRSHCHDHAWQSELWLWFWQRAVRDSAPKAFLCCAVLCSCRYGWDNSKSQPTRSEIRVPGSNVFVIDNFLKPSGALSVLSALWLTPLSCRGQALCH